MTDELKLAQKTAWRFYKHWKAKRPHTYCHALKCEVRVTSKGWEHIVGNRKATRRPTKDTIHRLRILLYAPEVIRRAKKSEKRKREGKVFYSLDAGVGDRVIRVVLEEDEKGNKALLSVIDKT